MEIPPRHWNFCLPSYNGLLLQKRICSLEGEFFYVGADPFDEEFICFRSKYFSTVVVSLVKMPPAACKYCDMLYRVKNRTEQKQISDLSVAFAVYGMIKQT